MKTKPGNGGFVADSQPQLPGIGLPPGWLTDYASSTAPVGSKDNARIERLENEIRELKKTIQEIQENLQAPAEIIELRDLTPKQARKEIEKYFKNHDGETITAVDIQKDLGIDIELASEICDDLEREGKIKEA